MTWLAHEWRLLWRSRLAMAGLLLLLILSTLAVGSGLSEVSRQQQTIARLADLQRQELATQQPKLTHEGDAGTVAYYTFLGTWDEPSDAAFLALGLRDAAPYVLRVRALALQAQLHDGEVFNPELALAGRFDFAFVLVYLAPLILIALLYDLVSGERHAGRLATLLALPGAARGLWVRRAALRAALVFACLCLPMLGGALASGMSAATCAVVLVTVFTYVAFWSGLALIVATRGYSSIANATALMGCWAVLTLVLPTVGNAVLAQSVPVCQGVELMLAQRQAVHGAWDLPREDTMQQFFRTHPQWQHTAPLPAGFHWKWYYAFQQQGDESVAPQVAAYREGLLARQRWSKRLGWLLPGVGVQAILHRTAATDLLAQLSYQDAIAAFHAQLRTHYYPYLFNEIHFGADDFAQLPRFQPARADGVVPSVSLLALTLVAGLAAMLGMCAGRQTER
ncbi:DUF3526 domain-containing protein [Dechloromonas denitrificans]|uniref:DUF3526 domain-containing protein n=1 Tax=Dechloromonas denitrificans TaxID=281362 RepID=UPI001CF7F951|nr:DUF3526 domain-containing protein [Dechloromonas denitrificans]UCV12729.1 DUF3526 domain-containing protein [Dechloromonas denitrificans]